MKNEILRELRYISNTYYDFPNHLPTKCSSQYISEKFNIKRNTASKHLNELNNLGKVVKINGRPVIFLPVESVRNFLKDDIDRFDFASFTDFKNYVELKSSNNYFKQVIGDKGSMSEAIKQGIAAMKYPGGLPIMYFGASGVGKSYLVEALANYCKKVGIIKDNAPFIEFNCAQYFNNPELLTSQLFGYVKGSFTGAESDRVGIIESADGGIVFLDEVHRLPPEGQEKLFTHMDKGVFHRVGEKGEWRKSRVRYIFATTEEEDAPFLETFLRRVPIICRLPDYIDRDIDERRQIVFHLFEKESNIVTNDIIISENLLNFLVNVNLHGNIGELKGLIKQMVANKYSVDNVKKIQLNLSDLPSRYLVLSNQCKIPKVLNNHFFVFSNGDFVHNSKHNEDIFQGVLTHINQIYQRFQLTRNHNLFLNYVEENIAAFNQTFLYRKKSEKAVKYYIPELQLLIQKISSNLFYNISSNCIHEIATYLSMRNQWEFEKVDDENRKYEKFIDELQEEFFEKLKTVLSMLENMLGVSLTVWDKLYIGLSMIVELNRKSAKVKSLILAHGYATASSIADAMNSALGESIFDSIDIPINLSEEEILQKISRYIEMNKSIEGLIIFIDIDQSYQIRSFIEEIAKVPTIMINNMTAELMLESANFIKHNIRLIDIVENISMRSSEGKLIYPKKLKNKSIIITCCAGIETSIKIKEMIENNLVLPEYVNLDITPVEYSKLTNKNQTDFVLKSKEVLAVIGMNDQRLSNVPYITLEELFDGETGKLYEVLTKEYGKETADLINNNIIKNSTLDRLIDCLLILDAKKVIHQIDECLNEYQSITGQLLTSIQKINLNVHISCMIERLIRNRGINSFNNLDNFIKNHRFEIFAIKQAVRSLERIYGIDLPMDEIAYICNIILNY